MAELTSKPSPDVFGSEVGSKLPLEEETGTSPLNSTQQLVFVRYRDHVLFNRSSALVMQPQIREAVGWLIYDCELYITVAWDRDADPPTLHGGDPKASGLVLIKSDILDFQPLKLCPNHYKKSCKWNLNCDLPIEKVEYAFRPSERKTHGAKDSTRRKQI